MDFLGMDPLEFQRMCWLVDNYRPSLEQMEFHQSPAKIRLVAGGVRGGKSRSTAREADKYTPIEDGLGWLVGPDYEQPRAEFKYLYDLYSKWNWIDKGSVSIPAKGPCSFSTKWGFRWETKSSTRDTRALASFAPNVYIMCEAAQQPLDVLMKGIERATENNADIICSGTFETSMGWYPEWFNMLSGPNEMDGASFAIPTWSNLALFPGGFDDEKIQSARKRMPEDLFWERYGGRPAKPSGLVFPKFDRKVHMRSGLERDPDYPVEIAVDPGNHAYAVLFIQRIGPVVRILDEIYLRLVIAQQVIPKFIDHPLSQYVERGVMDVAGTQHQANHSQLEVWASELRAAGRKPVAFSTKKIMEADWRNAITLRLGNDGLRPPLLEISTKCSGEKTLDNKAKGLVAELEMYTWPKRPETASLPFRPTKQNEDALSALGYYLVHHYGSIIERNKVFTPQPTFSPWQSMLGRVRS